MQPQPRAGSTTRKSNPASSETGRARASLVPRHGSSPNARRDRDVAAASSARSTIVTAPARNWVELEGWACPQKGGTSFYYWRHGRTLCGAYERLPYRSPPQLQRELPTTRQPKYALSEAKPWRMRHCWKDSDEQLEQSRP